MRIYAIPNLSKKSRKNCAGVFEFNALKVSSEAILHVKKRHINNSLFCLFYLFNLSFLIYICSLNKAKTGILLYCPIV